MAVPAKQIVFAERTLDDRSARSIFCTSLYKAGPGFSSINLLLTFPSGSIHPGSFIMIQQIRDG